MRVLKKFRPIWTWWTKIRKEAIEDNMITRNQFTNLNMDEIRKLRQWLEFAAAAKDYEDVELNELIKDLKELAG